MRDGSGIGKHGVLFGSVATLPSVKGIMSSLQKIFDGNMVTASANRDSVLRFCGYSKPAGYRVAFKPYYNLDL